jgi:hypothetical protein
MTAGRLLLAFGRTAAEQQAKKKARMLDARLYRSFIPVAWEAGPSRCQNRCQDR